MKATEERTFEQDNIDRVHKKLIESNSDMNQLLSDLMTIALAQDIHNNQ